MSVVDAAQVEVLSMDRPLKCQCCCCFCCLQELEVSAGGMPMGTVTQEWSVMKPSFSVRGPDGQVRLQIHGPCCVCKCCADVDFPVMSADGSRQVGTITKQWGGMTKEVFTDASTFGVTFPHGLDPATKATLFGATFLIGYMFFERDSN
ncbi:phospholipid scramblase 2-like [Pollicipes pollicipes]|nr:phospholipid scramblase 2-like [Pollicipes pollicipes]